MDGFVLAFVAAQAVLLAVAVAAALGRGRTIGAIRDRVGSVGRDEDVVEAVRRLRQRVATAEWGEAQQRRDLAYLADLIGVGIVRLEDDLRVDVANRAAHVFLGRAEGTMIGRTAMEAFVDARIEAIVAAARDEGAATGEVRIRDADGPAVVVRARRSPVRGVWVVLEDVSELRRLQQIRAEFIDNLSHELRTPLTTIGLLAETLGRDAEAAGDTIPARMRERIAKIELETTHIGQMVNELLDLTRIEGGSAVLHLDDVDLGAVARAASERLRLFAERQGVALQVGPVSDALPVRGDADRLAQVFVNLLHNAVKFSRSGGTVEVDVGREGHEVIASVRDHGIGIPASARSRVFERFYKVDQARARGGGTGLGLAISRHIVEQHGGRIWVESEEGRGSVFRFALPAVRPVDAPARPTDAPAPPTAAPRGAAERRP